MKAEFKHKISRLLLTIVIFALFGVMFMPFFTPLLMAALFGFALERIVSRHAPKRSKRKLPTALILFAFFLLIALPIGLISYRIVSMAQQLAATDLQKTSFFQSIESLVNKVALSVQHLFEKMGSPLPDGAITDYLPKAGSAILTYTAGFATSAPEFILNLFIFSLALYFFLTESRMVRRAFSSLRILHEQELDELIRVTQRSSYTTLVVSATIGAIQASVVAVGGLIFGYKEFFLVFVITFFTSFIPVIGAAPVAVLLSLLSFIQGEMGAGIGLLVVAIVAGSVDNVIKPWIVASSSEENLNPIISLVAIIGAIIVYGLPGLLLGPILMELALKIVPILYGDKKTEPAEK